MRYTLLVLLVLVGCGFEPPNEEVFHPPAIYRTWFIAAENCSGIRASFAHITWLQADLPHQVAHQEGSRIWIDRQWIDSAYAIRHEVLHYLLNGDPMHQSPVWPVCQAIRLPE